MKLRPLVAELVGTAVLVFFAVGVATLSFGFGTSGTSIAAGVVATALAFGLVLGVLAYALGPVSGCHINPAVTLGALADGRLTLTEALGYWVAQFSGGLLGALLLWGVVEGTATYRPSMGLGADGYGAQSMVGLNLPGALVVEVVLTAVFVFVVLAVTRSGAPTAVAGVVIGLTLTTVHLVGIPLTGTSVNPARSLGPAVFGGGPALTQLWLFIVGPLVGGALAAGAHRLLFAPTRAAAAVPGQRGEQPVGEPAR